MSLRSRLSLGVLALVFSQAAFAQPPLLQGHKTGEQVYQAVCMACHDSGVAHAPKMGERTAWVPLIEEGQSVLTGHAWVGVRAMPARGGSDDISLVEFARAVAYMARAAGATWQDPDASQMLQIVHEADKRLVKTIKEQKAMQRELHRLAKRAKQDK